MALYEHLLATKTKEELAKLLVKHAHENAALKNEVHRLEHEVFWMKVVDRNEMEKQ